jgi:hypothetical protein
MGRMMKNECWNFLTLPLYQYRKANVVHPRERLSKKRLRFANICCSGLFPPCIIMRPLATAAGD